MLSIISMLTLIVLGNTSFSTPVNFMHLSKDLIDGPCSTISMPERLQPYRWNRNDLGGD